MEEKISIAKFFNLLKLYWKSNPDKSLSDIWLLLVDTDYANDLCILNKLPEIVLSEEKAYNKLLKLCSTDDSIDNFINTLNINRGREENE